MFQISLLCENGVAARHYAVICKQLLNANDRNRVRWAVLGLPQDGASTDLFENPSEINLKGDLTNATTFNPLLFSLDDTFNHIKTKYAVKVILFDLFLIIRIQLHTLWGKVTYL